MIKTLGMVLECLGSSSAGNCYMLHSASETLVIECGVDMLEVKKALGWSLRRVVGCLVSHEHKDHAKHIKDFMRCGITVMALGEVFSSQEIRNRTFCKVIEPMKGYKVGGFKVFALPVEHDVPCLGFVIEHDEMGKTLFITDTMLVEYQIKGLSHIMIEANYSDDVLQENIDNGIVPVGLRNRLMHSHMELQTTAKFIANCDLADVNEIVLLHLSSQNSNLPQFHDTVAQISAKPVYIASKGFKIDFSKQPY